MQAHGETGWLAYCYPLTIGGLIYAASMVLLNDARRGSDGNWLAYWALGLSIAALAANVAAGDPWSRAVGRRPPGVAVGWLKLLLRVGPITGLLTPEGGPEK